MIEICVTSLKDVAFIFCNEINVKVKIMLFDKTYKKKILIAILASIIMVSLTYIKTYFSMPEELTIIKGEALIYNFRSPFYVRLVADDNEILKLNGGYIKASGNSLNLSNPVTFESEKNGSVVLDFKIFGILPLRSLRIDVVENIKIVPCGNTVGVKLNLTGILVVGTADIRAENGTRVYPAREAGIRAGDLIVQVNGMNIKSIRKLVDEVEKSRGNEMKIRYKRGGAFRDVFIRPAMSADDREYHIGLWVRDNSAGIGTLTFYDPATGNFAALGHGITDIDTGTLMPVSHGEVLESCILDIKKGEQGVPGELKGVFVESNSKLGNIQLNCEHGIYGKLNKYAIKKLSPKKYPIAVRSQIKAGKAKILANINDDKVEEFEIEIIKINRQNADGSKGMVIRITDRRLLELTGGIVQGMSGSPILQNGKVIGAVTHVLVNDPTRGYGIFIESMIKNLGKSTNNALRQAM